MFCCTPIFLCQVISPGPRPPSESCRHRLSLAEERVHERPLGARRVQTESYQDSMIGTDHRLMAEARMRARAVARSSSAMSRAQIEWVSVIGKNERGSKDARLSTAHGEAAIKEAGASTLLLIASPELEVALPMSVASAVKGLQRQPNDPQSRLADAEPHPIGELIRFPARPARV